MKHPRLLLRLALLTLCCLIGCTPVHAEQKTNEPIHFTSVPDIFNWNISNPQPGWEDTLDWFFKRLKREGPDFTLVAGDIMDARWYEPELVKQKTEEYWGGFVKRFKDHDITVYVAPGDHEYGDDRGLTMGDISRLFGEQFTQILGMPRNGPKNHLGRAFYVRQGNLLVITLDTFEDVGKRFAYTVGDEQLAWMDNVLTEHKDAEFVIVQGHLPIVGPVKSKNSSASMMKGGTDSAVWKLMVKHGVDVYLCGEHHRITVHHRDGIWQVVHGALWGTQTDLNYMRGVAKDGQLKLELLEFDVQYAGGYIGDHPHRGAKNRPREQVELAEKTRTDGPRVTGTLVLEAKADQPNQATTATGWFDLKP
ncbi:MAG: metallophosphoesterase family protein [Phycisphaeraceae bacterium]